MRVVLLKGNAQASGGLEKSMLQIGKAFQKRGAEVTLLTTGTPKAPLPFAMQSFPTPAWPPSFRIEQFDQMVQKWLKNHPAEIIFGLDRNRRQTHLRAGNGVHAAWLKQRSLGKSFLCQINPLHRKILSIERASFEDPFLKTLFVNSNMVKEEILHFYNADPKKIEVVHNGVEWHEWNTPFVEWEEQRALFFKEHKLDPQLLHLLFIGHGYRRKGLDLLLKALSLWKNREVHLSVVGKERELKKYQEIARSLGVKQVTFFGQQEKILPFYQMADALAIPSFYDPFANVTLEALAMGLFVLSSKHNGGHEVLPPMGNALLENLSDPHLFIEALKKIPPKTRRLAEEIRKSVSHLDYSQQLQKIVDCTCLATS